jgi:hypothetical protein
VSVFKQLGIQSTGYKQIRTLSRYLDVSHSVRTLKLDKLRSFFCLEVKTGLGEYVLHVLETEPFYILCLWVDDRKGWADLDNSCAPLSGFGLATALCF